jgi:hypothetical protein
MIVVGILAGCQGTGSKSGESKPPPGDPLFGATAPPVDAKPLSMNSGSGPYTPTSAGSLGTPTSVNQPLAQPTNASPAVLATGAYPPLSGSQDLRIGAPPVNTGNRVLPRSQTPPGVVAVVTADPNHGQPRESAPGVVPLDESGSKPFVPAGSAVGGLESALSTIGNYQPKWHKLENTGSGVWRFSCAIPDKGDPTKSRNYEAEGPTALAAVQNVISHINRDSR